MKIKNALVSAILSAALLLGSVLLSSCGELPRLFGNNEEGTEIGRYSYHDSFGDTSVSVLHMGSTKDLVPYNGYLYYMAGGNTIRKFSFRTGKSSSACVDPACAHTPESGCAVFDDNILRLDYIKDDMLYYTAREDYKATVYWRYDLKSGKKSKIATVSPLKAVHFEYGDEYFIETYDLKEGGDANNPDDYLRALIAFQKDGSGQRRVCFLGTDTILFISDDGYFYFLSGDICRTDKDCKNREKLMSMPDDGGTYDSFFLLEDRLLFTRYYANEKQRLFSLDLQTKEVRPVLDEDVFSVNVTEKYIYFLPYDFHELGGTHDTYDENGKIIQVSNTAYTTGEVVRVSHDGKNREVVAENDALYFEKILVEGDYLIGQCIFFDRKTLSFDEERSAAHMLLDLTNGNYKKLL